MRNIMVTVEVVGKIITRNYSLGNHATVVLLEGRQYDGYECRPDDSKTQLSRTMKSLMDKGLYDDGIDTDEEGYYFRTSLGDLVAEALTP